MPHREPTERKINALIAADDAKREQERIKSLKIVTEFDLHTIQVEKERAAARAAMLRATFNKKAEDVT